MTGNWRHWQPPSQPHSNELEHRVTATEIVLEHTQEVCEERHQDQTERVEDLDRKHETKAEAIAKRLSLHEKAILLLAGALQIVAQDKYPTIAKVIRGILMP